MSTTFDFSSFTFESATANSDLTPRVQSHLSTVFQILAGTIFATFVGSALYVYDVLRLSSGVASFAAFFLAMYTLQSNDQSNARKMQTALYGMLQGQAMGGLVETLLYVDPSLLVTAIVGTGLIFTCFAMSALLSPRRSYFYLSGVLSSALSGLFWTGLASFFFKSSLLLNLQLYGGLLVFVGFVVLDCQVIIERASDRSRKQDAIGDAIRLYVDVVAIFVRIAIILLKNANRRERDSRKKRRR